MKNFSPIMIRIAIALVFIWFGLQQLSDPSSWFGFLPTWVSNFPISQTAFIYLNGWFELMFGTALLFGFYSRITSFLLGLHLMGITYTVGYGAIGVRDFGLAFSALSIAFSPSSPFSLDAVFAPAPRPEPLVTRPVPSQQPQIPLAERMPLTDRKVI